MCVEERTYFQCEGARLISFNSLKSKTLPRLNISACQVMVFSILPNKKQKLLHILCREDPQNSEFHLFFGSLEDTINCF